MTRFMIIAPFCTYTFALKKEKITFLLKFITSTAGNQIKTSIRSILRQQVSADNYENILQFRSAGSSVSSVKVQLNS